MKTDGFVEKQERFFHTSLQNPAGFRTVFTGSAEVNPQTTKPDRSFATKTGHFHLLPTVERASVWKGLLWRGLLDSYTEAGNI